MQPKQIPLNTLLRWLWEDNPKLHNDVLIQHSITTHGFNDRVGVSSRWELILEGHGRLGNLKRLKDLCDQGDVNAKRPVNIELDPVLGDWLIPCDDHDNFETREQAYQYALEHNRSGVQALDLRDYDVAKLQKAIGKASGAQLGFMLPGFEPADFASGSTSQSATEEPTGAPAVPGQPVVNQLPKTAVFDPAGLSDAPTYQSSQAPQAFVAMVTAPDTATFVRILSALTFGERKSIPDGARFASVEGGKFLAEWERLLAAQEPLVVKQKQPSDKPLKGQLTLAGETVGNPDALPGSLAGEAAVAPAESASNEPAWDVDGNCTVCNGKGYTGTRNLGGTTHKIYCTVCNAAGTRSIWDEAKVH